MKMIAFWKYDTFPFCLWGELVKADKDYFYVKGYEGFRFNNSSRIAFLPDVQADVVIAKLEKLKADKKAADAKLRRDAKRVLDSFCGEVKHALSNS